MRVLVTGANGFLGHQVVRELIRRQLTVRVIVRRKENIWFDLAAVELFVGNFCAYTDLKQAAADCDAIIHAAAVTDPSYLHYRDYSQVNAEGTAQVIRVADELNIRHLVYVSSVNTIGFGTREKPADENAPIQFPFTESFYAQSKLEAERLMMEASRKPDRHIVIVNPGFMLGAFDPKPGSGRLLIMGYKKRWMWVPSGGKNFVPVNDVAIAVCNALIMGTNGHRYLATGANMSFKDYYRLQKKAGNYRQTILSLPDWILIVIGKAGDVLRSPGIKTEVSSSNLRQLMIQEFYSNRKAKDGLNMPETALETAIEEAIDWFAAHKMLNKQIR